MDNKYKKSLFLIVLAIALIGFVFKTQEIISFLEWILIVVTPVITGFAIAFILNVPMKMFENVLFEKLIFKKYKNKIVVSLKRPTCLLLAIALIVGIIGLVLGLIIPQIVSAFEVLAVQIKVFIEDVQLWATTNGEDVPYIQDFISNINVNWDETWQNLMGTVSTGITGILGSTVTFAVSLVSNVFNFILSFIFAIYVLFSKERLKEQFKKLCKAYFPPKFNSRLFYICNKCNHVFSRYIAGQCTESLICGGMTLLGMTALGLPYAPMIAALTSISVFIPIIGATASVVVGAFMIMMVDPIQAIWYVIFMLIEQQVEGNLIYPKVVGDSIGLPPMWVLASITVAGTMFGIVGMLFALPVASVIYILVKENVNERIASKELENKKND